jgi:hypothetical protein
MDRFQYNCRVLVEIIQKELNCRWHNGIQKMAEFDFEGWYVGPYIAENFNGVWGDFDVHYNWTKKNILSRFRVLQNQNEIDTDEDAGVNNYPRKKNVDLAFL